MTTVAECSTNEEAMVLQSLLGDCGLAAFLPDDMGVMYKGPGPVIRVQVADEDAETALSILRDRPAQ